MATVQPTHRKGPSLLDAAFAILRKGEKAAKATEPEAEPVPVKKAAAKKPAAKKGARK
jgi:hypothetical protein